MKKKESFPSSEVIMDLSRFIRSFICRTRHSFSGTPAVTPRDGDVLLQQVQTYRHAFETTERDRDHIVREFYRISDPSEAGMYRLDFRSFLHLPRRDREGVENNWISLYSEQKYEELALKILSDVNIRLAHPAGKEYLRQQSAYWIASYFAKMENFSAAAAYASELTYSAPPDAADLLPYDLSESTRLARFRQQLAIRKGCPSALIISLPKSASAFLSHAISEIFEVPIIRSSLGDGMRSVILTRWADQVMEGGAVTHEHCQATNENIKALAQSNASKVWILVRDPRDAAFSLLKMNEIYLRDIQTNPDKDRTKSSKERQYISMTKVFSQWISNWISAKRQLQGRVKIHFIRYNQVASDLPLVLAKIFPDHVGGEASSRTKVFLKQINAGEQERRNYRSGIGQEWRHTFSENIGDELWEVIPEDVRGFLNLNK